MDVSLANKIEMLDINTVIPYGKNAKVHTQKQVESLAEMIRLYGWDQPIVVDGNMEIIKGHCRYKSAKHLNLKEVPVIVRSDLSAAQIKASRIADNKIAESDWDLELLETEIRELDQELLDYLGFEEAELDRMLSDEEKKQVSFEVGEKTSWELVVTMTDEDDQQDLFIELRDRGYKVKAT